MIETNPFDIIQLLANDDKVRENPFNAYAMARSFGDVININEGFYVATTYSAVDQVLRGSSFGKVPAGDISPRTSAFDPTYPVSMLFLDPPDHTRLRRSVVPYFTPSKVVQMHESIERYSDEFFKDIHRNSGGDLVADIAVKLPISVIADMLGVSREEHIRLKDEVSVVARSIDIGPGARESVKDTLEAAGISLLSFFTQLIESNFDDSSLLSSLLSGADPLTIKEASVMAMLLFMAGFETTSNLLGSISYHLSNDTELYDQVIEERENLDHVVDEFLRLESPVQLNGRSVQADVVVNGVELKPGSFVLTLIGGANRDPSVFSDPDAFQFNRTTRGIMSFGAGIHHCVGAALARAEARIFLEHFLKLPRPNLVTAKRKPSLTLRGFDSVVIRI